MPAPTYYTYIMSSRTKVLYIGITSNLELRVQQHKQNQHDGFTKECRCHHLVWFERYATAASAIAREKQLKGWRRAKKLALIEQQNLEWQDLSQDWRQILGRKIGSQHTRYSAGRKLSITGELRQRHTRQLSSSERSHRCRRAKVAPS